MLREKAVERAELASEGNAYVTGKAVDKGPMKTQPGKFTLLDDGLCVGCDSGDAVSEGETTPGEFEGEHSNSSACRARTSSSSTLRGWRPQRWRWTGRRVNVAGQVRHPGRAQVRRRSRRLQQP
jgi:hypothetical protein